MKKKRYTKRDMEAYTRLRYIVAMPQCFCAETVARAQRALAKIQEEEENK